MRRASGLHAALAALALATALLSAAPSAAAIRVSASDPRGVTLEVTVGAWTLSPPGPDGRVRIAGLADFHELATPGRPMLPAWAATLALPPDARPTARVIASSGEQSRGGARLVIAGRPVFRGEDGDPLGPQPAMEAVPAIADGAWPGAGVEMGEPFGFRGRRLVMLELRPFRYDESAARVWSPLTLTVRVDFNRPAGAAALPAGIGAPDRHVDAALATSVLNWDQAAGWRVAPRPLADARSRLGARPAGAAAALAFEEDEPEVRVRLDETALYRIPYDDLAANGYPPLVPVAEVSVHRHEYLEGASPPYGTFELPCEVQDANGNDVFDSGDAIWLWAQNWAERTNATVIRRFWGDAEVVFVTRRAGGGLRVPHRPGWNDVAGLTPPASYPFKRHFERDATRKMMAFVPVPQDTNIGVWQWTDASSYYSRPDTMRFAVPGLDNTRDATISVRWVGRNSSYHVMWAAIRNGAGQVNTVVDSVIWFGKGLVTPTATFPGAVLTEGNTNFLRQWGKSQLVAPDPQTNGACFAGLDWFDLTYWRRYVADRDYLRFNSTDGTGDVQMSVGGFLSDSIRVYDVSDPGQPVRVTLDPAHVFPGPTVRFEIQDVLTGGRREYVAAAIQDPPDPTSGPRTPPATAYGAVTRRRLWDAAGGDYLLVVPEAFAAAVQPLADLRTSQGLSVLQAPVESIYDEFGDGRHSAAAIQRFARYAYEQWDARFLMLVGDGTLDPNHNSQFSGRDWIPILPSIGPVGTNEGYEIVPSDNRFAFITGNSNPLSSDTARVVPEMMVGRLTVNSVAEANTVIAKIVAYENVQPADVWRKRVLLSTDDAYSSVSTFGGGGSEVGYCHRPWEELFVGINNTMQGFIESDSGLAGMDVEQFNLRSYVPTQETYIDPLLRDTCRADRATTQRDVHSAVTPLLIGKLSEGQLLWNYQGHANEHLLTHEDLLLNQYFGAVDDVNRLANDDMPFLLTAFSCHVNMFAREDHQTNPTLGPCLGEDLLALANGRGAVASWASVGFEVVPRNEVNHVNIELIRNLFVNPPRDEFLGADDRGSRVVLGEAILSTLFRFLGTTQTSFNERGLSVSYTLLGDPATRLSIGRPLSQVLANGSVVTSGTPVRLHTPGDTLRVEANVVSNVRLDSLALYVNQGSGDVEVPPAEYTVTPAFPDTAAGNLYGGRRFRLVYRTQPAARSVDYAVVARDRYGLVQRTDVVFRLEGVLRSSGVPIADNDEVAPTAALSLLLLSPAPIPDPLTGITLTINGATQSFTAAQAPGDASGREWILSWTHAAYAIDQYTVVAAVQGGGSITRQFRVSEASGRLALRDLFPFPNPFDNSGTRFSFTLLGGEDADVKVHVFSQSGRSIYTQAFRGLSPGYHQLPWDGRDAEGDEIANGVYFYRLSVTTTGGATTQQLGRLVKLRKPRRVEEPAVP